MSVAGFAPELLGLTRDESEAISDDGVDRALGSLFRCEQGAFVLTVVRHTIDEFNVTLGQLHNDSTTITFHGNYSNAASEETLDAPSVRFTFDRPRDKYKKGYQTIKFGNYSRYVGGAAEMAKIIRSEKDPQFSYDHDLSVQESILRACNLSTDK